MKKWNKILAVAIVLTTAVSPVASTFSTSKLFVSKAQAAESIADNNLAAVWAQPAILAVKQQGIMQGDPDGNFRPLDHLTREEFASLLVKALHLNLVDTDSTSFHDVQVHSWAHGAIETAYQLGYMKGDGGGTFRPQDPISREEVATILVRSLNVDTTGLGASLTFADKAQISEWAQDAVAFMYQNGVVKGDGVNFAPQRTAERQEIAVILNNALPLFKGTKTSVDSVSDAAVVLNGVSYTVADSLKGLFSAANSDALKGASIQFAANDKQLTKVTYLEITNSGKPAEAGKPEFSGDLVLDAGNAQVFGDLKISGDYISLKNLTVAGNLEIGKELQNDFYANNLKVVGKTIINGGDTNTVVYENSALGAVEINKPNVRVEPKGKTTVGDVLVNSNATITADAGVTLPKVTLGDSAQQVELNAGVTTLELAGKHGASISGKATIANVTLTGGGDVTLGTTGEIGKVEVTNKDSKLTVNSGASIKDLVLPDGKQVGDVVTNFDAAKIQITNVNGKPINTPTPSNGGGGGVGPVNHKPEAKSLQDRKVKITQTTGVSYVAADLATDVDGDAVKFVQGSVAVSGNGVVEASLQDERLVVTPKALGHGVVKVRVTDGQREIEVNIPVNIITQDAQLHASVLYGGQFHQNGAEVEAVVHLAKTDEEGQLSDVLDLSNLVVTKGTTTLVQNTDYFVDEEADDITLDPSFLNTLGQGAQTVTFTAGDLTVQAELDVLGVDTALVAAILAVNNATDVATTRTALEAEGLRLQLTPYSYLTGAQRDLVAQAVLDGKGTGYTSRTAIQDRVDMKVADIQLGGDEASAIAAINAATTVEEMLGALASPHLHLDNADYSSLEGYERDIVAQYFLDNKGAGYADRDAIQTEFDKIINMIIDDWYDIVDDVGALKIGYAVGDSKLSVTQDLTLPTVGAVHGAKIEWTSSNAAVVSNTGHVTRPTDQDTKVVLTAHLTNRYEHYNGSLTVTVKVFKDGLTAVVTNGSTLVEKSAGVDKIIHVEETVNDVPVPDPNLATLVVKNGNTPLVLDSDYTVDEASNDVSLAESYLDQLSVGTHTFTLSTATASVNVDLTVLPMDPALVSAIQAVNAATDVAGTRAALEAAALNLQLTPYSYLTSAQRNQVAQAVLDGKGTGYTNRASIQDALDVAVTDIQLGGDEASSIQAVNDATSIEEMLGALASPQLHLDNADYSSLEGYERDIVGQYFLDNKGTGYESRDAIQTNFDNIVNMILDDWYAMVDDILSVDLGFGAGDSYGSVTQDVTLPLEGPVNQSVITWTSSNTDLITNDGHVTRPAQDTQVTLMAHFTHRYEHYDYPFKVLVKAADSVPLNWSLSSKAVARYSAVDALDVLSGKTVQELLASLTIANGTVTVYTDNTQQTVAAADAVLTADMVLVGTDAQGLSVTSKLNVVTTLADAALLQARARFSK
ncbi:immunoglobulin-like domain-containing protein [Tumebacillus permanentifrigoris]|uniref:S-layer family protein n=1 Tax=Tumebacillus permanentifrigoris TaxID=378543 RepID=A0A316D725_9BACL|nr:immunoglobulin-like domain-containing protein [Tumebacillus permanentifrigoris]PWK11256.1 S-layer family protein [Tumebacillus permanentifrigoris]